MKCSVLLISRDHNLLSTRALVFQSAGYGVICSSNAQESLSLALNLDVDFVIICHTYTEHEQAAFGESLHETHPGICVIAMQGSVPPDQLLRESNTLLTQQRGGRSIRVVAQACSYVTDFTVPKIPFDAGARNDHKRRRA
jgi:hypothetical protein